MTGCRQSHRHPVPFQILLIPIMKDNLQRFLLATALCSLSLCYTSCDSELRTSRYLPTDYPKTQAEATSAVYSWTIKSGIHEGEPDSVVLPDPYEWLEVTNSSQTRQWVKEQQQFFSDYMTHIPYTSEIRQRLEELHNYERSQVPVKAGNRIVYTRNTGLQEQPVLYIKESLNDEARILFDPNTYSPGDKVALGSFQFSNDGHYATICLFLNGSDWMKVVVMDIEDNKILPDDLKYVKGFTPVWRGEGFYYGSYAISDSSNLSLTTSQTVNMHVNYHRLGQAQSQDVPFVRGEETGLTGGSYEMRLSDDERYLFLKRLSQEKGNTLYFQDLTDPNSQLQLIASDPKYSYEPVGVVGGKGYVRSDYHFENGRLLSFDIKSPDIRNWKAIVDADDNVLTDATLADDGMVLTYSDQASMRAYYYNLNGTRVHEIPLPGFGNVVVSANAGNSAIFFSYSSTTYPITVFKYDQHSNTAVPFITPKLDFNPDDYVTERVFCTSADGTKIPMFISYKKGFQPNGNTPTYLFGYGGFGVNMNPRFNVNRLLILEQGCIFAQVCTRGGGEYGDIWHTDGIRARKENVFNDFIAAAEYLQAHGFTSPEKLCLSGKDHGGLVVAVLANRRPDLFSVAIPRYAMLDMMRYQLYAGGWNWRYEFGTSRDSREKFDYLIKYSPVQCIHANSDSIPYPAILAITGDCDETVIPCHTYKYVATLQATETGPEPKLAFIMPNVGHDYHRTSEEIDEFTSIYSFFLYNVGMKYKRH